MPTEIERLVVSLEASITKYERAMQKAAGVADKRAKEVETRFTKMSQRNEAAFSAMGQSVSVSTSNIAAQFQDIAVQLQGGQNPFTVALQQGTQLGAALGNQGLKGTIAALGAGIVGLVNPVSIATIALIALGGAAVQYFGSLLQDGPDASEELKKQEDLIRRVADRWGDATPALRTYVEQLDRAKAAAEDEQAKGFLQKDAFAGVLRELEAIERQLGPVVDQLFYLGTTGASGADELQQKFGELRAKVRDGKAQTADFEAVLATVNQLVRTQSTPALVELQGVISALADEFTRAAGAAGSIGRIGTPFEEAKLRGLATDAFVNEQQRVNALTSEQLKLETEIGRVKAEAERAGGQLSEQQALELAQQRLAAEQRRSELAGSRKSSASESEREMRAVLELIAQLEREYEALGLTEQQQQIANSLRLAGAAATDEQKARIIELIEAINAENAAQEEVNATLEQQAELAQSVGRSLANAMRDGKVEGMELLGILVDVARQLALTNLTKLNDAGEGGILGNLLAGVLSGFATGTANTGGARGQVRGLVHGQEAVIPLPNGGKVPVELRLPAAPASGGAQKVTNNVYNYGNSQVETRPNGSGGIDVIVGAVEQRIKGNMARGNYRQFGVAPGTVRR